MVKWKRNYSTNNYEKHARYWSWFNQQIKLTSDTKYGVGFGLCHAILFPR